MGKNRARVFDILRGVLISLILIIAIPGLFLMLFKLNQFIGEIDPLSKYERAEVVSEETLAELSEIDSMYADMPAGMTVVEVYSYFDGWRTEYVRVYLEVLDDSAQEMARFIEERDVGEISDASVMYASATVEAPNKLHAGYAIHNGHHNFGTMIADNSYDLVYVIASLLYFFAIISICVIIKKPSCFKFMD